MQNSQWFGIVVPFVSIATGIVIASLAGCGSEPSTNGNPSSSSSTTATGGESSGTGGNGGKGGGGGGGSAGSGGGSTGSGGGSTGSGGGSTGSGGGAGSGNGEFRFELPTRVPGLASGFRLLKDLNGDGRDDAYRSDSLSMVGTDTLTLAIAQPDGTFSETHAVTFPDYDAFIARVGDFNADGHIDMMIRAGVNRYLLLGHGDGVFDAPLPVNIPADLYGDMNGDKLIDLIEYNTSGNAVRVYLAQANGSYVLQSTQMRDLRTATLADVDGDGDLDLFGTELLGALTIFNNDGTGTIAAPVLVSNGANWSNIESMGVTDLNEDGRADIVVAADSLQGDIVMVFLGEASGNLVLGSQYSTPSPLALHIADLDDDGHEDVLLVSLPLGASSNDLLEVFYGDGLGGLGERRRFWNNLGLAVSAVKDVDGDTHADVVIDGTHVAYGAGNRELKAPRISIIQGGLSPKDTMSWVDFDGDAKPEVVMAQDNGPFEKYSFDAGLRLGAPSVCSNAGTVGYRVVRDVTGDGNPDVYATSNSSPNVTFQLWISGGECIFGSELTPLPKVWSLQWVDFNGDALLDLLNGGANKKEISIATAPGLFDPPIPLSVTNCYVPVAADFNGDKNVDLACIDNIGQTITFWFADGGFQYSQGQKIPWITNGYTEELIDVNAIDVDGDGDQDLLGTTSYNVRIDLFLNDGTGNFTRSTLLEKTNVNGVGNFTFGDFDADGAIELVVPKNKGLSGVYRFTNAGTLTNLFDFDSPRAMFARDVDHDGDLDLTYTRDGGDSTIVAVVRNLRY